MAVKVIDLQHVEIDGTVTGAVADTVANYPSFAGEIQAALVAWASELAAASQQHGEALSAEKITQLTTDLASMTDAAESARQKMLGMAAELDAKVKEITENYQGQYNQLAQELQAKVELLKQLQQQLEQTNAVAAYHQKRADIATALVNHMQAGDCPAAVATSQELRRIELQARKAQLAAEEAALTA